MLHGHICSALALFGSIFVDETGKKTDHIVSINFLIVELLYKIHSTINNICNHAHVPIFGKTALANVILINYMISYKHKNPQRNVFAFISLITQAF